MADHLVRIHGTEQDRVNCSFFGKMGACRHGEKCDRRHNRPTESQTLLFPNMYTAPPAFLPGPHGDIMVSQREQDEAFDEFYVDAFVELTKYGAIEELNVCANPGVHLAGNVYLKFSTEAQAAAALQQLNGRLYDGKPLKGELCPVTDFREARCRQYQSGSCDRRMCNFLHLQEPSTRLHEQLYRWQLEEWKQHRHYERPPPSAPPANYDRHSHYDRFEDRRGHRRDDRRGRGYQRYDDRRPPHRGRSPSPPRGRFDSDPFGRDARHDAGPDHYQNRGRSYPSNPSEQELEERLAQVRSALASQSHPSSSLSSSDQSKKRDRPSDGFDFEGGDPKFSKYQ